MTSPHVSRQPGVWSARRSDGASEHLLVSQHARAPMSRLLANVVASRSRHRFAVPIAKDDQKLRRSGSVSVGGSADPSGQRNRSGLISSIGLRKANRLRGRSLSSAAPSRGRLRCARIGRCLWEVLPVGAPAVTVTCQLPADRRGRPSQTARNGADRLTTGTTQCDLLPLSNGQIMPLKIAPAARAHATGLTHPSQTALSVGTGDGRGISHKLTGHAAQNGWINSATFGWRNG